MSLMPRSRDFDAEPNEDEQLGPISFVADGQEWHCVPGIPAGNLYDLSNSSSLIALQMDYIEQILVEEDIERWREATRRRGTKLDQKTVDKIFTWLAEVYAGRPTESSSGSGNGSSPNGTTSTEASSAPEAGA